MKIVSISEDKNIERRVAITPEIAKKYLSFGFEITISENYGDHLGFKDDEYKNLGVKISNNNNEILESGDIIVQLNLLSDKNLSSLKEGQILVGVLNPYENMNKIILCKSKNIKGFANIEKLALPTSVEQINKIVVNNVVKKEFKTNSSLKINNYQLDKNLRRLIKNNISLELTEKEIELIELLSKRTFTKKKEILSTVWKYSSDADTHTVETHIYRLRKKIKEIFKDESFIRSEKKGYTI